MYLFNNHASAKSFVSSELNVIKEESNKKFGFYWNEFKMYVYFPHELLPFMKGEYNNIFSELGYSKWINNQTLEITPVYTYDNDERKMKVHKYVTDIFEFSFIYQTKLNVLACCFSEESNDDNFLNVVGFPSLNKELNKITKTWRNFNPSEISDLVYWYLTK